MSDPEAKRQKRTYRACYPCRSRKLRCNFGDPDRPWDGPCQRCLREGRDCIRGKPTPLPGSVASTEAASWQQNGPRLGTRPSVAPRRRSAPSPVDALRLNRTDDAHVRDDLLDTFLQDEPATSTPSSPGEITPEGSRDTDALVTGNLGNPHDALKLLASASNLSVDGTKSIDPSLTAAISAARGPDQWQRLKPVQLGIVEWYEAEALFIFFETEMVPLYPLLLDYLLAPSYFPALTSSESFLLGCILAISARYSTLLVGSRHQTVQKDTAEWVGQQLSRLMSGAASMRNIASVEALLLLSEWPLSPMPDEEDIESQSENDYLEASLWYDRFTWTSIGWAVRLAQELGIHHLVSDSVANNKEPEDAGASRAMRTWVYCYNADRHISVRLGRNTVLQPYMSSHWWEKVSDLATKRVRSRGSGEVWVDEIWAQSLIACLMGSIQEHLYASKDVTRSLLKTGAWESFSRSLRLEVQFIRQSCQAKLRDASIEATLLRIEIDYVVLYANALALRSLQEKLRRRRQAQDLYFASPSLLNLIEGPWILEALAAARSIIELTINVLDKRHILRYCPARIFQRVLFAATFLYKALATGVVEHGQHTVISLLNHVIGALQQSSIDDAHFPRGFAELLYKLGKPWRQPDDTDAGNETRTTHTNPRAQAQNDNNGTTRTMPEPLTLTFDNAGSQPNVQVPWMPMAVAMPSSFPNWDNEASTLPTMVSDECGGRTSSGTLPPSLPTGPSEVDNWHFDPTLQASTIDQEQAAFLQTFATVTQMDSTSTNLLSTLFGDDWWNLDTSSC